MSRTSPRTLGAQVEEQLRHGIRNGTLRPGARLSSTRDLARQLGVSRRIVVDAYAQLSAEGYLSLRPGTRARVSEAGAVSRPPAAVQAAPTPGFRFDLRPSAPDLSGFPRSEWLRSLRKALGTMTDADLGYGDARGVESLRIALADYLGRVRGVVADPDRIVVTSGYTQGLGLVCDALAAAGAGRIALEDPSNPEDALVIARAGLESTGIEVDEDGVRVDEIESARVDGVVLTPAHQNPTGVVLTGERRSALLSWLRTEDAVVIEDDYDAEFRYDGPAVGALQGLDPERVIYAGTVSKTLAPALRLGWLVVPQDLLAAVIGEKRLSDRGTARIEQHAFADFLARGELDRHLRRMRAGYRGRRDALVTALGEELPEAVIGGVAAGLHLTVHLPGGDERAILEEARDRGVRLETMSEYRRSAGERPPSLLLGYGQLPEPAIRPAVKELAAAIRAAGRRPSSG